MKTVWIAVAACLFCLAGGAAHAKGICDVHHLGYTKTQCEECSNMMWSINKAFPNGVCVATSRMSAPVNAGAAKPEMPAPTPKIVCDIHHLGYTQTECDRCSNMRWSVSTVFPRGTCVGTAPPQTINLGGANKGTTPAPTPTSASSKPSCTLTSWGGATLPLNAPNFSMTGARVTACSKGYDLSKSQLHCSTGVPATPPNAPTTNVTCNKTTGVGGNTQVTINGQPCCLN